MTPRRTGEFARIARIFAPLAADLPGALGLRDDTALLASAPGCEFAITTDTIVSGVHYVGDEPAGLVARKLLRMNLSDLAAMGARPLAYLLNIALPSSVDDAWLEGFAAGLAADQVLFGIRLAGGDSVSTPGPSTFTVTAIGEVERGKALKRSGARPGDVVYVTGTIGDGALGLKLLRGEIAGLDETNRLALVDRYQLPQPRLEVGQRLVGLANAALDISDGLAGDLMHIAETSNVACVIEAPAVPLSPAGRAALAQDPGLRATVLTGGDDYELLFTASAGSEKRLAALAEATGVSVSPIGRVEAGTGVRVLDERGAPLALPVLGYEHG